MLNVKCVSGKRSFMCVKPYSAYNHSCACPYRKQQNYTICRQVAFTLHSFKGALTVPLQTFSKIIFENTFEDASKLVQFNYF